MLLFVSTHPFLLEDQVDHPLLVYQVLLALLENQDLLSAPWILAWHRMALLCLPSLQLDQGNLGDQWVLSALPFLEDPYRQKLSRMSGYEITYISTIAPIQTWPSR